MKLRQHHHHHHHPSTRLFSLVALIGIHDSDVTSAFTTTYNAISRTALPFNNAAIALSSSSSSAAAAVDTAQIFLSPSILNTTLATHGYIIVPNFLSQTLVDELRQDIITLRGEGDGIFKLAKIGQDATNALNTDIRIAETCFLGRGRKELASIESSSMGRNTSLIRDRSGGLYDIIDTIRTSLDTIADISTTTITASATTTALTTNTKKQKLDPSLTELLYAYYPKGGYYRRHRDAIPNSASALRKYSLLLYLNDETYDPMVDAGQLRLHLDGGGDECPQGVLPNYIDINPTGGTLVLFKSDLIPHEVLNTNSERYVLVGWFNRGVSMADIGSLSCMAEGGSTNNNSVMRMGLLTMSMAMVTYGIANIIGS